MRRQLQVIEQAALDGAQTVRRVQEFTRVRHDERFETLDVNQVLIGVRRTDAPACGRPAPSGAASRSMSTSSSRARAPIAGNASELREVFTNLVLNAVDAMPRGGSLRVDTGATTARGVEVRIRDTGVGMEREDARARVRSVLHHQGGQGHGARAFGGLRHRVRGTTARSRSTSEPGPRHGVHAALPRRRGRARSGAAGRRSGRCRRCALLVVDDEEPVLSVLADLLRRMGQDVRSRAGRSRRARGARGAGVRRGVLRPRHARGQRLGPGARGQDEAPGTPVVLVTRLGIPARGQRRAGARRGLRDAEAVLSRGCRPGAAPGGREHPERHAPLRLRRARPAS